MPPSDHYVRFIRALALAGTASLAACASNPQPDVISTGQPCSLEGQPCTAYSSTPGPTGGGPPCCYCAALPVDSGAPDAVDDSDAMADAATDPDASDVDADANPGVPGVYHSFCIGPLTPPETLA